MNEVKRDRFIKTLTSMYKQEDYVLFLKELLTNMQVVAPDRYIEPFHTFAVAVAKYSHIGNYIGEDNKKIALFSVCLKNDKNLENARSMQRNFVKSLLESGDCAGALVSFYTAEEPDKWRLSFVRMDYEFSKGKINTKLTPAKRYSYLVGKGEPSHTAQERLFPIFADDNRNPSVDELEEAFSVEAVTKEFFDKYRDKYLDLKESLEANPQFVAEAESRGFDSEQFAKKLMGQIVFLYFIQKKGWLGVNAFPFSLTEKEYKNAFYSRGQKPKELMPKVYKCTADGRYVRDTEALLALSDSDETELSKIVKGDSWGDGPKDFMRQIYNGCEESGLNFFDDYLEPLFYTGLNEKRDNDFFPPFHRKIPFLNGGLFEEMDGYDWENNDFSIPNDIFSNYKEKGREADGILDVFDRYNFTMAEDEPMEREVAIDPEMLGKVFENLLDVSDRKSKGAFYTPREIVHYMCQETLIQYLADKTNIASEDIRKFILLSDYFRDEDVKKTKFVKGDDGNKGHYEFDYDKDMEIPESILSYKKGINRLAEIDKLLANIKVVDLAVGSGAFPLGMLNEIVKARDIITTYMTIDMNGRERLQCHVERNLYNLKRSTIRNCIFACDIEASATDITKLRLWLSLVIDNQIMKEENLELGYSTKPRELPNLDCNVICGNSLIDEFHGVCFQTENNALNNESENRQGTLFDQTLGVMINELIDLQLKLYDEKDHVEKESIKDQIQDIYNKIVLEQIQYNSETVDEYYKSVQLPSQPFVLWQLYFPRVFRDNGGFDIVIGNPPYVGEEGHKELFQSIASTSFGKKYYTGKMDLWYFFTSKGLELLRDGGQISFIAPNNWMTTAGGKNMRKHIAEVGRIRSFLTFNNVMIFESASQQTMIFRIEKRKMTEPYKLNYKAVGNRSLDPQSLSVFLATDSIGTSYVSEYDPNSNLGGDSVQFLDTGILRVVEKIRDGSERLYLQNDEIINGIHPHHGEVTKKMLEILPDAKVGDGIFILKNPELEDLNIPEEEKKLLHPYYDSNSIGRYFFDPEVHAQIIYTTSDFKDVSLMDDYPVLKAHLDRYVDVITSDNRPYGLHRARKQEFFEKPKICSLRKCQRPMFSYIEEPSYVTAEWYLIQTERLNMKYMTAVLNSSVIKFWLLKMGKMQGSIYQVDKDPLVKIPLAIPSDDQENKVLDLYQRIIEIKRRDGKDGDTSEAEKELDLVLYSVYGLDSEDVEVIESTIDTWENSGKKEE